MKQKLQGVQEKVQDFGQKLSAFFGTLQNFGIVQRLIIVLALISMIFIWPAGVFEIEHMSTGTEEESRISSPLTETEVVRQYFSPNYEKVKSINVYVANEKDSVDTMEVAFRLYNQYGVCILQHIFALEEYAFPGFVEIPIDMELLPGELYFYTIGGRDGQLFTLYCNDTHKTPENGAMYYKEIPSGGTTILTQYEYLRPMGLKRILFWDCLIGMVFFAFFCLAQKIRNQRSEDKWRMIEKNVKKVLCALVAVLCGVVVFSIVVLRLFAQDALNIIVLAAGIIFLAVYLWISIQRCPSDYDEIQNGEKNLKKRLVSFVRSVLWAAAIIFCCMHTNSMTNYEKGLHMRCLLTCIGLLFISYGKKREVFNIPNLVWTLVMLPVAKFYISFYDTHIEYLTTAKRSVFVIWAIGLIVINLFFVLRKETLKACKNILIPYAAVVALFMGLCVVLRQERQWPIVLMIVAFLIGFKLILYGNWKLILEELCNGILLAFAGTTCFCVCRRAYQYYLLYRYGGVFSTATANTLYLCVPLAAALSKIAKNRNAKSKLTWYVVTGAVISYMVFTASRTGITVMVACVLFYLAFPYRDREKGWFVKNIKVGLLGLLILVASFVSTFTVTRMLPAVVGNPYYFFNEYDGAAIYEETPWSGYEIGSRYMTIERLIDVFLGRAFSGEEEEIPFSKRIDSYDGTLLVANHVTAAMLTSSAVADLEGTDYSNGRAFIYKEYLSRLGVKGHNDMGIELENGEYLLHAHNSYIQVMYDYGVPVGIVFLIVCLWAFIRACRAAYINGGKDEVYNLPMYLVIVFGVASITEWCYYLTLPLGFAFIIMLMVLCDKRLTEEI